ncbi:MAG: hypothetical protein ACO1O6_08385 [Bacteroidota bacterium]
MLQTRDGSATDVTPEQVKAVVNTAIEAVEVQYKVGEKGKSNE